MADVLKIVHFADIQYNVRDRHMSRKIEYEYINKQLVEAAKNADLIVFAGDCFEHWNTNNVEESLWIDLVNSVFDANPAVHFISVDGNHDIKQRFNSFDKGDGNFEYHPSSLAKLSHALSKAHPNYHHLDKTGVYDIAGIAVAVWDHNAKYRTGDEPYSPWQQSAKPDKFCLEIFHDPVKNCLNFDGNVLQGDNESRVDVKQFQGDYVALGDIHKHQQFDLGDGRIAAYPGSASILNFGEGDYYENGVLVQSGNDMHGYMYVEVDVTDKHIIKADWHQLKQLVYLHTVKVNNGLTDSHAYQFNAGPINKIRFSNAVTKTGLADVVDAYMSRLSKEANVVSFDISYALSSLIELDSMQEVQSADDLLNTVHNKEWLTKVAHEWSTAHAMNNSKIDEADKQAFIEQFMQLFTNALSTIDLSAKSSKYELLSVKANQFMALTDVDVNFAMLSNLTRINGNNGNGKTTLFRLIKWLATGFVDTNQSAAASKQNSIAYFNDKLEDDVLTATLEFVHKTDVASEHYKLQRTLTRHWKRNGKNLQDPFWRNNITKAVEEVQLTRLSDGYVIDDAHEVAAKLYEIFGSIWELCRYVCIDQSVLDSIISMKPEELNDWLLDQLGINLFNELVSSYDKVKQHAFDGLSKPALNVVQLQTAIGDCNALIADYEKHEEELAEQLADKQTQLVDCRTDIETLSKQMYKIPSDVRQIDAIIADGKVLHAIIVDKQTRIAALPEHVDSALMQNALQAKNDLQNLETTANAAKTAILQEATAAHESKSKLLAKQSELQAMHAKWKQQEYERFVHQREELQQSIDEKDAKAKHGIIQIAQQINNSRQAEQQQLQQQLDECNKRAQALHVEIAKLEADNAKYAAVSQRLSGSNCPTCGTPIAPGSAAYAEKENAENSIRQNNATIAAYQQQIADVDKQSTFVTQQLQTISMLDLTDTAAIIAAMSPEVAASCNTLLSEIAQLRDKLAAHNSKEEQVKAAVNPDFIKQYNSYQSEIANIDATIAEVESRANAAYAAKMSSMTTLKTALEQADALLASNKHAVEERQQLTASLQQNEHLEQRLLAELEQAKQYAKQAESNAAIQLKIDALKQTEQTLVTEVTNLTEWHMQQKSSLQNANDRLKQYKQDIVACKKWQLTEHVVDCYRLAVSKKGLVSMVFERLVDGLNNELGKLLQYLSYRIYFDKNDGCTLKMLDLMGAHTVRPIRQMSGMQSTFAALSIIFLIVNKRRSQVGDLLLIDEISGKLSDASAAAQIGDANTLNYCELLLDFLKQIAEQCKVLIVDHVMDFDAFQSILNITRKTDGTATIAQF